MPKYRNLKIITDACCRKFNTLTSNGFRNMRGKAACAFIFLDGADAIIEQRAKYLGECTAPQAEYNGLIFALDAAVEFCRGEIAVWMDSELVIRQMNGDYCIRSEQGKLLFDEVKKLERRFLGQVRYFHHDRGSFWARAVDKLANGEYSRLHGG